MSCRAKHEGKEQHATFVETMKDDQTCDRAIREFAEKNIGCAKFRRKQTIDWASWNEHYGKKQSQVDKKGTTPYEEREYCIEQETKFGRTPERALE
eukprot:9485709-Pyramimonas_sp.AAC.1